MRAPLEGVRVVEAASYVTGPFAGMMLAQLGADVVKVEPRRGDTLRRYGLTHDGLSATFVNLNHGKHSIALDLKDEADRSRMLELVGTADVLLQNWRPGVAASLGLGSDELLARHPRLVYVAISGYGATGPKATRPVFDSLIQAAGGLAAYEGGADRPTTLRSLVVDKTTAAFATQAVLAALLARERTGRGGLVGLSMLDAMSYFNFPDMCQDRTFLAAAGQDVAKGRPGVLRTSDGHIVVAPVTGRQISAAVTAVGHPEWARLLKAATSPTELTDLFYDHLETVTPSRSTEEWEKTFIEYDVPVARLCTVDEHLVDPQTVHNAIYSTSDSPRGPVRRVRYPVLWDGEPLPEVPLAPELDDAR